jgi:hypothetical protein
MQFELIGPPGKWRVINAKGARITTAESGEFPGSLTAEKLAADRTDIVIELEYSGSEIITPFGENIPAGKLSKFHYRKFFQPVAWKVDFYGLDTSVHNPIKTGSLFSPVELKTPVRTENLTKLDYAWWGGIKAGDRKFPQFMTVAQGTASFPAGEYEIGITWDDAVRFYIDDKLVLNEWNPSLYSFDESPHKKVKVKLDGTHRLRIEHVELGGFATLSLKIKPVRQ